MNEQNGTLSPIKAATRATPARLFLGFIAGFIAVLLFHQGLRAALMAAGAVSVTPYALEPGVVTAVPRVLSRALWGGVWGALLVLIESRLPRRSPYVFWFVALAFGALVPSLFAWFVLAPLKGQ